MYSETRFNYAKSCMTAAFLHRPTDRTQQVEFAFLRSLLSAAAQRGQVTPNDVYHAVESSGACDLAPEIADQMIRKLWNTGDHLIGALSPAQARELRKLHKLCLRVMEHNDLDAMIEIAELI